MTAYPALSQTRGKTAKDNPSSTNPLAKSVTQTRIPEEQNPAVRKPGRGSTLVKAPDPFMNGAKSTSRMPETSVGVPTKSNIG